MRLHSLDARDHANHVEHLVEMPLQDSPTPGRLHLGKIVVDRKILSIEGYVEDYGLF